MKRYSNDEITRSLPTLAGQTVAIVGYGSQGRAQALNLRDSGIDVTIGVRDPNSASAQQAEADGFEIMPPAFVTRHARLIMILTPDETHAEVYAELGQISSLEGKAVGFAHGYALTYGLVDPDPATDIILVAPKGIGPAVRSQFEKGSGVAALVATAQNPSGQAEELALAYAAALGSDRVAILQTTFEEETTADLFSEQAVIVGGMTSLIKAGFDSMVDAGIAPELAYYECVNEAKLILDMIVERGFAGMFENISNTAEFGALHAGGRIISDDVRREMDALLKEIKAGEYAQTWNREVAEGMPQLLAQREQWKNSLIEKSSL